MCLFVFDRVAFGISQSRMWCCLHAMVSTEWSTMENTCMPFIQMTTVPYTNLTTFLSKCKWNVSAATTIFDYVYTFLNIKYDFRFFFFCSQIDLDTMHPIVQNAIYAEPTSVTAESKRKVRWFFSCYFQFNSRHCVRMRTNAFQYSMKLKISKWRLCLIICYRLNEL